MKLESKRRPKISISLIVDILLLCMTALFSGSALSTVLPSAVSTRLIFLFGAVCSVASFRVLATKRCGLKECCFLFFVVWLVICSLVHPVDALGNLGRILVVTIAYYITERYSVDSIMKAFSLFCAAMATIAILGTLLLWNTSLFSGLPLVENVNGVQYGFGLLYNYIVIAPNRVCGFFWEPGLLATCMVYGMSIYIAIYAERITKRELLLTAILLLCCLMANSSAGFVLAALCVVLVFFKNKKIEQKYRLKNLFQLLLFLLALLLILNIDSIIVVTGLAENEYVAKLLTSNVVESTRMQALGHNLEIWSQNPILGIGFSEASASGKTLVSDTSTSSFLLAAYGIGGLSYTIAIIVGVLTQKHINSYSKILLCVILLLIVNKEPHFGLLFSWVLIFMLLGNSPIASGGARLASSKDSCS